jgi:uncharacterized protein (TIGR02246 family)
MKLTLILLFAGLAFAQDAAEQIKKLERAWADATLHKDTASLNRIMADDLKYVHGNASIQNKQQFISSIKAGEMVYHSIDFEEDDVRMLGDTAVASSLSRIRILIDGREQDFKVRFLRVYAKRNGNWQMIAHQATRLP